MRTEDVASRFADLDTWPTGDLVASLVEGQLAAIAALHAYRGSDSRSALGSSRVGRMMIEHALGAEVDCASDHDSLDVVPTLVDGQLVQVAA